MKSAIVCSFLLTAGTLAAAALEPTERYYEAIRSNDLSTLRELIKTVDVNTHDKRGTTPLMYSAAVGSVDAMRLLIQGGAEVNAKNAFEATALMWCATNFEKVRLLVEKGANVNARSKPGRTPLLIAASSDGSHEVVKYLLDKGADVSAKDGMQQTALHAAVTGNDTSTIQLLIAKGVDVNAKDEGGQTALMGAAANGNAAMVRLLLAKGADVNAVSAASVGRPVQNGVIALGSFTALLVAAPYADPETVGALLEAGVNVNARDARGMTPLMLAIATDRPNPATVKLLLSKGADAAIKSKDGETALDWAQKFNYQPVLKALGIDHAGNNQPVATLHAADRNASPPAVAVQKGLQILQRTSGTFFNEGGCFACHAQNLTGMALSLARDHGIKVDEKTSTELARGVRLGWSSFEQPLLQRIDPPGGPDMLAYAAFEIAASGTDPDHTTDAIAHNVAAQQLVAGNWHMGGIARPPMQDGDFSRTALSLRVLQLFGPEGRRAEFSDRVGRAASWLLRAEPRTTEDRNMQLLGLTWTNTESSVLKRLSKDLMSLQRADGGWAQTPELASDAYATGQALYALHEAGVSTSGEAYRRGVEFLLRTQLEDGSWHVKSRAAKFQPYFQSGFSHDHDQWISNSGTAWATMALSYVAPEKPAAAAMRAQ
jgi:ankyrin repeat protein